MLYVQTAFVVYVCFTLLKQSTISFSHTNPAYSCNSFKIIFC